MKKLEINLDDLTYEQEKLIKAIILIVQAGNLNHKIEDYF